MLSPEVRSVLVEQLRPPSGFTLSYAVATTFTLDLPTALVVPLAFAGRQMAHAQDPLSVSEAVHSFADRVDIFAQAGNVAVPRRPSDLMALLEPMVHLVRRPRPGRLFHPKTWFLRFASEDDGASYRLLVLSRNLTADRSWDTCLTLEGTLENVAKASNRPLAQLLKALPELTTTTLSKDRRERISALAEEVRRVRWEAPPDVAALSFHVLGLPGSKVPDFAGSGHLVVSPFCNAGGLSRVLPVDSRRWDLVSRQESLDVLPAEWTEDATCRVLDAACGLAEDDPDTGELQGLHGKIFIVERGHRARTFVGSANATDAAFGGNIEILVELEGKKNRLGIDALLAASSSSFLSVLQPYGRQAPLEEDPGRFALENAVRAIAELQLLVQVTGHAPSYSWRLRSTEAVPLPVGVALTAAPLTRHESPQAVSAGRLDLTFDGLGLTDITPFVLLAASDGELTYSTVVLARLEGDPAGRFDEILAKQMRSPGDFVRFVKLLLGLIGGGLEIPDGDGTGGTGAWRLSSQGLFELLVRALSDQPAALGGLASLITRLQTTEAGRALLPTGFDELWAAVQAVRSTTRKPRV